MKPRDLSALPRYLARNPATGGGFANWCQLPMVMSHGEAHFIRHSLLRDLVRYLRPTMNAVATPRIDDVIVTWDTARGHGRLRLVGVPRPVLIFRLTLPMEVDDATCG